MCFVTMCKVMKNRGISYKIMAIFALNILQARNKFITFAEESGDCAIYKLLLWEIMLRNISYTKAFEEFYEEVPPNVQFKLKYALDIITEMRIVNSKLVKKLTNTPFYELRISVNNEYRVILFAADNDNFRDATSIVLLNGFIKKSTKDYKKQIERANHIIEELL